jgi:hypothetical protein
MDWIDQYSGKAFRITTVGHHGSRYIARVKTYGDVLLEYEFHPESKCADANGNPCSKQTVGLLRRRHIRVEQIKYIGKESNSLEEVESGLIHSAQSVYTEYPDPRRDDWQTKILPALRKMCLKELAKKSRMSRSALKEIRAGRSRPHPKNQKLLAAIVEEHLRAEKGKEQRIVMPYKDPERKRQWEREHREQRNAQRRTRTRAGKQIQPGVLDPGFKRRLEAARNLIRGQVMTDHSSKAAHARHADHRTGSGWKAWAGFMLAVGLFVIGVMSTAVPTEIPRTLQSAGTRN